MSAAASGYLAASRSDIAELDVPVTHDYARPFRARTEEPAPLAGDARGVERVAGDVELQHVAAGDVGTDDDQLAVAVLAQQQHLDRVAEIILIELLVTMKMSAVPNGRPSANGACRPPGAIIRSLLYVSRTKPQVAFGSSLSRVLISSAVTVSGIGFAGLTNGYGSSSEAPACASERACRAGKCRLLEQIAAAQRAPLQPCRKS
jgi:hypothetical protein